MRERRFDTLQLAVPLLMQFHAYRAGYVHLWRRGRDKPRYPIDAEGWKGTFPVQAIRSFYLWAPSEQERFLGQLKEDSYASINTLYDRYDRPNPPAKYYTRLNAAYVDLDYGRGKDSMTDDEAIAAVDQLVADGILPTVSVIEQTGRGLHVFWLLSETEAEGEKRVGTYRAIRGLKKGKPMDHLRPPYAFPHEIKQYRPFDKLDSYGRFDGVAWWERILDLTRWPPYALNGNGYRLGEINRALVARIRRECPELVPESGATSVTLHMRLPGSINSKSGTSVVHTVRLAEGTGIPATYTLDGLRQFLGLAKPPRRPKRTRTKKAPDSPEAQRGAAMRRARCTRLWDELQRIRQHRGGFREGQRKRVCFLSAIILRGLGLPDTEIEYEVFELARSCRPPLEAWDAKDAIKGALGRLKLPKNVTLATDLGVTATEVSELGLNSIDPDHKYRPDAGRTTARRKERWERIQQLVDELGNPLPLSLSELAARLSYPESTLRRDIKAMGVRTRGQQAT